MSGISLGAAYTAWRSAAAVAAAAAEWDGGDRLKAAGFRKGGSDRSSRSIDLISENVWNLPLAGVHTAWRRRAGYCAYLQSADSITIANMMISVTSARAGIAHPSANARRLVSPQPGLTFPAPAASGIRPRATICRFKVRAWGGLVCNHWSADNGLRAYRTCVRWVWERDRSPRPSICPYTQLPAI